MTRDEANEVERMLDYAMGICAEPIIATLRRLIADNEAMRRHFADACIDKDILALARREGQEDASRSMTFRQCMDVADAFHAWKPITADDITGMMTALAGSTTAGVRINRIAQGLPADPPPGPGEILDAAALIGDEALYVTPGRIAELGRLIAEIRQTEDR